MGDTPNRQEETAPPRLVRLRIMDPVLLSAAALVIGVLSYLGTVDSREDAKWHAELNAVEARVRQHSDERDHYIENSLDNFRSYSKEINTRQDEALEWTRKAIIQVAR